MSKVVVIGASAGGIEALIEFIKNLPSKIDCTIFIVMHMNPNQDSLLIPLLARGSPIPVVSAKSQEVYKNNHIYICPANMHMLINSNTMELTTGAKINHFRPSIEVLFTSAALHCGPHTIGILLSGLMDDGVEGLQNIKHHGGITMVQDPDEAQFGDLPSNALAAGVVDYCLPIKKLVEAMIEVIENNFSDHPTKDAKARTIEEIFIKGSQGEFTSSDTLNEIGKPSVFTCPDCSGTLWEINDKDIQIYRCRTGHQYSLRSLKQAQDESLEQVLWAAARALEESSNLSSKIAKQMHHSSLKSGKILYEAKAQEAKKNATILRTVIDGIINSNLKK